MSRNVSIEKSGGHKYVTVRESYRNAEGKPRSRVVERLGKLEDLEKKDPDFVTNLKERVRRENEAERRAKLAQIENSAQERIRRLEGMATCDTDYSCAKLLTLGSALLRRIWQEDLNMPQVFRYLQSKSSAEYSYDKAAFLLSSRRILQPASKKKTFEQRFNDIVPSGVEDLNTVYRVLDRLATDKQAIIRHINRQLNKKLDRTITVAFYDVTTYAFESRTADGMRNFGLSKDHKVNEVQVVLGLVIDEYGIPIDYDLFEGNTSEFSTMLPMIDRIKKSYKLGSLTVVADRGLNSNENLTGLKKLGCDFVLAQKVKNCSEEQKQLILSDNNWDKTFVDEDGVVACRYKTLNMKKELFETKIDPITGKKKQSRKPVDEMDVRWIISHSQSRAKKDNDDLDRAIEKAGKVLKNKTSLKASRGYKSLIVIPKGEGKPHLDTEKIAEARRWAGYYAVCTNLTTKTAKEVMQIYRNLWRIEDCFRVSKTTLEARPCFVWTEEHIRGHFMSCFISLVIEKYMRHVLRNQLAGITNDQMNEALRSAALAYDDGNPQVPLFIRLYSKEGLFDKMLKVFGLEAPCHYETDRTLAKKLHLKEIARGESTVKS